MRHNILYSLSRHLAIWLERGFQVDAEMGVPVYLSHPLDVISGALSGDEELAQGHPVAALYLAEVSPTRRFPRGVPTLERALGPAVSQGSGGAELQHRVRRGGPWMRLRFGLVIVGGRLEEELGLLSSAVQRFYDHPYISHAEVAQSAAEFSEGSEVEADEVDEEATDYLVELLDQPLDWKELGLGEHRRSLAFDVFAPLPSTHSAPVPTILQRDLDIQGAGVVSRSPGLPKESERSAGRSVESSAGRSRRPS